MRVAALLLRVAAVRVQGAAFGWQAQDCMLVASDSRPILMAGAAFGDALGPCRSLFLWPTRAVSGCCRLLKLCAVCTGSRSGAVEWWSGRAGDPAPAGACHVASCLTSHVERRELVPTWWSSFTAWRPLCAETVLPSQLFTQSILPSYIPYHLRSAWCVQALWPPVV